jgi:hypothetical protein
MANDAREMVQEISMLIKTKYYLDDLIKEYEEYFMSGGIQQSYSDLKQLVEEIGDRKFHTMCEIGIADGATLWLYSHLFAANNARFIVLDMDIRSITRKVMMAIEEITNVTFEIHERKSLGFELSSEIDFLHIDGDHGYEEAKYDYDTHSKKVVPGGLIIIHDTLLIAGPSRLRQEIEASGTVSKTFNGADTLCNCFGPNRVNPQNKAFGTTVIWK